jgi:hypothetical protein
MSMKKDLYIMTRLDWFALLSGIIGLLADIITICSVAFLKPSPTMTPTVIWILVPFLILYTTIVLSCYARRVAVVRHLATRQKMTEEVFRRIDKGGKMIAKAVGTPLLLLYGIVTLEPHGFSCQRSPAGCEPLDHNGCTVRFTYRGGVIRIDGAGYWRKGRIIYEDENKVY